MTQTNITQTDKRIVAVDSQKLDAIQSCMFLFKLRFGSSENDFTGSQPLITPDYFERGGLLHDMLEQYYKLKRYRDRWQRNNTTHSDVVRISTDIGRHKAARMHLDIAEVEKVIDTFRQYTDHWENDSWNNVVATESVGSKVLYEDDDLIIVYEVKMDLILDISGVLVPVDHKTASARRDPNALSNQFKGYCWFLGVHNLIVNEIGFQKTLKPVEKFRRHTLRFSANTIQEWVNNTVWWVRFAMGMIDAETFPKNFTSCDKYSGCAFKEICLADPEVQNYKLQSLFEEKKWDIGLVNL